MDGARALEQELGAPVPPALAETLDPADLERFAETLRRARREQSRALADAGDEAMRHVPAVLRPAVRKLLTL